MIKNLYIVILLMTSFIHATVFTCIYFIFRFFEMRIILKKQTPLKHVLRDSLLVYISVLVGEFFIHQLSPIVNSLHEQPSVFINEPEF